jgi:lipopolysaccharide export LptBFGC system permease protein LptF
VRLRLDAYLFREILPPFFVALLAFLVFIGLELILSLSDALFARGVSAAVLLRLLSYRLPYILTLAAPAGVLLATFLALARLASDRELLAFQALGYSLRRLLLPFLVFGLLISSLSFVFSELVVPTAEAQYRKELLTILYRGPAPLIQEHVFFRGTEGELFYVERYSGEKVEGVVVYDLAGRLYPRSSFPAVVTAKEGEIAPGRLILRHGRILNFGAAGELAEILAFRELSLEVGERLVEAILGGRTPSEMSARELRERIDLLRRGGHDVRGLLVEYHGKLAVAAAALVFVLFGAPLGVILGHRGRATGMVLGFLLAAGAQALFLWARTLARRGFLPPALGGWLPHLVFGSLGILLFLGADRLRLRGLLLFLLLGLTGVAAPPFRELIAEELVVADGGRSLSAKEARMILGDYEISAGHLSLLKEEDWVLLAQEVEVRSAQGTVRARSLAARLAPEGTVRDVELQAFSGAVKFSGPEKEETIIFSAEQGQAHFREGKLAKVAGKHVTFTTCPCAEGAPYLVAAEEFLLIPQSWLFARNLGVRSFGYPLVWLPFYAARLGEEGVPFLPEIGRAALGFFLRWSFPWTPVPGTVGALILTVYPEAGRVEPALQAFGENAYLHLSRERAALRLQGQFLGEPWAIQGRHDARGLFLSLSGRWQGWEVSAQAGLAEAGGASYTRLPEIVLSRGVPVLGGNLSLRLGFGRYREGEVAGWRAGISGSWGFSAALGAMVLQVPLGFGLDQYPGAERVHLSLNPTLSLGGISLWYRWQGSAGRSPFAFDATPNQSQAGLTLQAARGGWSQSLAVGWDFLAQSFLTSRWVLKGPILSVTLSFRPLPPALARAHWDAVFRGKNWVLRASGGLSGGAWEDTLLRGAWEEETWAVEGGLRLNSPLPFPKRLALSARGSLGPEWSWALSGEYDFHTGRFVQVEARVYRTFSGCLRVGLSLYPTGFRLSLDVPAFPEVKVRFAPLDEGLLLGGL